ncbi:MAG TPA: DEAD/DEAH box helicase, partial [Gammaproteobacteria bacterium]|nr:DEAD/DEAH box helicase [Gammaproteobacteria bacterium]
PFNEDAIRGFRQRYRDQFEGDPQRSLIYRDVSNGIAPSGIEYYLPLFFENTSSLFDYLPDSTLLAASGDITAAVETAWAEITTRFDQRRHDIERPLLPPQQVFLTPDELTAQTGKLPEITIAGFEVTDGGVNLGSTTPPALKFDSQAEEPASALLQFLNGFDDRGRVLFATESAGRREHLLDILRRHDLHPKTLSSWQAFLDGNENAICIAPLEAGLHLLQQGISVITETQLFGPRASLGRRRRKSARDPDTIIRDLTDLSAGSPVVHEDYGVGRYLGLQRLDQGADAAEFLTLEYAGGDKLYVPVASLHLISRYTGTSPEHAPLHKLGTDQWARAKRRAAEKARDAAVELLDIYARRAAQKGHAFVYDESDYSNFRDTFAFDETPDQDTAIQNVLNDLTETQPMDRVVCGDVGFGKTEVALRAAFVAVQGGKQVALLVPTTLLAQQHYQSFTDRFADWPVRIEVLSRFRSSKQQKETLDALHEGTVDILIGTHGLLSSKVKFKDLGLVIIDEEHRFGVRHKEQLKKLRAQVHVLTLTATPIPRTLNMAMAGIRDLSIIATPPVERLSVKTFVSEWNDALLREAMLRELKRGGQVYFVHNSVNTIEKMASQVRELMPEAEVRVAHGQMRETELEQVMLDFYHRRFNILVCTTIIESGIDLPTANTIIINRADKFGLAQLHQMRGRVGRSHHRAYAYLVAP